MTGNLDAAAAEYRTALAAIEKASADFPGKTWVGQTAADCFERMARGLPVVAHRESGPVTTGTPPHSRSNRAI